MAMPINGECLLRISGTEGLVGVGLSRPGYSLIARSMKPRLLISTQMKAVGISA